MPKSTPLSAVTRGRVAIVVVAAVLAGALGVGVLVGGGEPDGCDELRANAAAAPDEVAGEGTKAYVLGDSWTSGWALERPTDGYAYLLAASLGWDARVDGGPGTGFANGGECGGQDFAARASSVPADAAVVVVEGGLNDADRLDDLPDAVDDVLGTIEEKAPDAQVYVVGVQVSEVADGRRLARLNRALVAGAEANGATFVDTTEWALPYIADDVHLTPEGHRAFAGHLEEVIGAATPSPSG